MPLEYNGYIFDYGELLQITVLGILINDQLIWEDLLKYGFEMVLILRKTVIWLLMLIYLI